jgi:hypothetical protein
LFAGVGWGAYVSIVRGRKHGSCPEERALSLKQAFPALRVRLRARALPGTGALHCSRGHPPECYEELAPIARGARVCHRQQPR